MDARTTPVPVRRIGRDEADERPDAVAIEEPLEIRLYSGERGHSDPSSLSVTMRTPGDDPELVTGFLVSEGIVADTASICGFERPAANIIEVQLASTVEIDWSRLQRNFYATSSCGVCGKASLEALKIMSAFPMQEGFIVLAQTLVGLPDRMAERQSVFAKTGGLHAAALFDQNGILIDVREDVGRHNAVDKIIGAAARAAALPLDDRILLVSGRASFEIMQKAYMAGSPLVAAVGAPSSLAVEVAWEFNMTLVGFLRDGRCNVYAGPKRIV